MLDCPDCGGTNTPIRRPANSPRLVNSGRVMMNSPTWSSVVFRRRMTASPPRSLDSATGSVPVWANSQSRRRNPAVVSRPPTSSRGKLASTPCLRKTPASVPIHAIEWLVARRPVVMRTLAPVAPSGAACATTASSTAFTAPTMNDLRDSWNVMDASDCRSFLFPPDAERLLCRPIGQAEQHGLLVGAVPVALPARYDEDVTGRPSEALAPDRGDTLAFDACKDRRIGRTVAAAHEARGEQRKMRADRRRHPPAIEGVGVSNTHTMPRVDIAGLGESPKDRPHAGVRITDDRTVFHGRIGPLRHGARPVAQKRIAVVP